MERRKAPRIRWEGDCVAFFANQNARGRIVDVSTSGMAMLIPRALPVGGFVRVQWWAPAGGLIDSDAVVVRDMRRDQAWLVGLRVQHDARVTAHIAALAEVRQRAKTPASSPVVAAPPAPGGPRVPSNGPAMASGRPLPVERPVPNRELAALYRAALDAEKRPRPGKR